MEENSVAQIEECISNSGKTATDVVKNLLPTELFEMPKRNEKLGDIKIRSSVDNDHFFFAEIKKNSANQTRAVKYIPLIVVKFSRKIKKGEIFSIFKEVSKIFVVPPNDNFNITRKYKRGQHNEISIECLNFPIKNKDISEKYSVPKEKWTNLYQVLIDAYNSGEKDIETKEYCQKCLKEIVALSKKIREGTL
jgi:hypothetical protein